jgi:4-diphosphocytidyl-2-C-methyl-D-erythritol kinase
LSRSVAAVWCGPHSSGVSTLHNEVEGDLAGNPLLALVRTGIENGFEEVVFSQQSLLADIKRILADSVHPDEQAIFASLSGSGASLFGLYPSEGAASAAHQRLALRGIRGSIGATLTRAGYWSGIFIQ